MNSPVLQLRVSPEMQAALLGAAERRGSSVSDIVRIAIARELGARATLAELPPHPPGPGRGRHGAATERDGGAP